MQQMILQKSMVIQQQEIYQHNKAVYNKTTLIAKFMGPT